MSPGKKRREAPISSKTQDEKKRQLTERGK